MKQSTGAVSDKQTRPDKLSVAIKLAGSKKMTLAKNVIAITFLALISHPNT
ncbi:hypothetical protein [Erwinia tracheiphila]|uniref:hypothetical protein n=1 Tax=Erwinia tracheiphila TaxID=65700 RepID=UPI00039E7FA2|nr:hypothetical protein [Erwinia tracheiphila]UIA83895.1 hypothetical protein LU604_01950 [Erwinia tracheiphila]UIA92477.1 hypothetical protein LU632_01925 [Erwinia tracheiphila]